jgi:hypothetical protein
MLRIGDRVLFKNRNYGTVFNILKTKHNTYYQIILDGTVLKDSSISYLVVEQDLKLLKRGFLNTLFQFIVILKISIHFQNYDY